MPLFTLRLTNNPLIFSQYWSYHVLMKMNLKTIRADTIKFHYSPLGLKSLNSSALLANSVKKLCHANNDSNSCLFWIGLGNLYSMTQYGAVQQTCSGKRTCCKAVSALTKYKSSFKWTIFPYKASWIQWSTSINVRFI